MRKCVNCGKEDGSWIVQGNFVKSYGFSFPRKRFVCSKKCLKELPKKFGLKFKIIKRNKEVKK